MNFLQQNLSFEIELTERDVNFDLDTDFLTMSLFIFLFFCIVPINCTIIIWITVIKDKTLIDNMILLDCVFNIAMLAAGGFYYPTRVWDNDIVCSLKAGIIFFIIYINRIIPITIVGYRYILVCHVDAAEKIGKDRLG